MISCVLIFILCYLNIFNEVNYNFKTVIEMDYLSKIEYAAKFSISMTNAK